MSIIEQQFQQKKLIPSDINEHLETLYTYAKKCETVAEFGVLNVTSTYAFAATKPKKLICVDLNINEHINTFLQECLKEGINARFDQSNTLIYNLEEVDLLFIDTLHTFNQLSQELTIHHSKVKKYIILHDTVIYGNSDEINYTKLVNDSNDKHGLNPAIELFLQNNKNWEVAEIFTNNNGLTILKNTNNV